MTVGDGLAKTKRVKTMPMDNVCKKPAASMTTPECTSSGHACVAQRYGLQDTMLTQYEKWLFKKKMDDPKKKREKGMTHDVPDEVLDEYMQLTTMQGNHGQQNAIDLLRKAWKHDPTWGHVLITDKIKRSQRKTIKDIKKA